LSITSSLKIECNISEQLEMIEGEKTDA